MTSMLRKAAIAGSAMLMTAAFAIAADVPTGVVSYAQNANVDGTDAALGANVYAGDALATHESGTLRLRVGKGQIFMLSQSTASITQDHGMVDALMKRGTMGFSATMDDPLEIDTPVGTLRPANTKHAYGQVTMDGPREVIVTSYEGTLALTHAGETRTIEEGKSYRVMLTSAHANASAGAAPQGGQGTGTSGGSGRGTIVFDALVIGGAAAAGLVLWQVLCDSETNPTGCQ
jgi:hypothetical protein